MTDELYTLTAEEHDGITLVHLRGEIDASNASTISTEVLAVSAPAVILDLSAVTYLDSAGMAMIEALRRAKDLRLVLTEDSVVARSLRIVGFDQLLPISTSAGSALASMRGRAG
jgi:anti-anti-sigma factor